jgi:hypothetical protein
VRVLFVLAILLASFSGPTRANACGPCGAGDTAITFGALDRPVDGRLRVALAYRRSEFREADVRVGEQRIASSLFYSPAWWSTVFFSVPVLARSVTYENLATDRTFGLGDAELGARFVVFRDRPFAPQHVLALQAQLIVPSASPLRDGVGALLPVEAQPGRGAFEPSLWAFWTVHADVVGGVVSASVSVPFEGIGGERGGLATRGLALLSIQPVDAASILGGVEARYELPATRGGAEQADGPGFSLSANASLALRTSMAWTWIFTARVPFVQQARGNFAEGVTLEWMLNLDV